MPHVINGIGTWYYGRRHAHKAKGHCEFCQRVGELESYDTTLYFVVLMVPLIPLGAKRILSSCPTCRQHRVMPLKQWQQAKEEDTAAFLVKLAEKPDDAETAHHGLELALRYQDEPLFQKLATTLGPNLQHNAAVQAHLGDGYNYFVHREQALEAYQRSLALEDKPAVRQQVGLNLLRLGRPTEAHAALQPLIEPLDKDHVWLAYHLLEGYQAAGSHDQALALLDRAEEHLPELANDKDLKKKRQLSEKHRASGKAIKSTLLSDSKSSGYQEGGWTAVVPKLIAASVVLGLLGLYLGTAWYRGQHRQVILVNGIDHPYQVQVQGREYLLAPARPTTIEVAEGELEFAAPELQQVGIAPTRAVIETSFWGRPFHSPVFVINPDELAVLEHETAIYAVKPPPAPPPTIERGQSVYSYPSIDYLFAPFPHEIKVEGNQSVTKTRLGLVPVDGPLEKLAAVLSLPEPALRSRLLKRLADLTPTEGIYVYNLSRFLPRAEALEFAKTKLKQRPPLVEFHRLYQILMDELQPGHDLKPEYERLVQELPGHGTVLYLRARLEDDTAARAGYERAATATPPSDLALGTLAGDALARGDFPTALKWSTQAWQRLPQDLRTRHLHQDTLLANQKFEELLALPPAHGGPLTQQRLGLHRLQWVAHRGDKAALETEKQALLARLSATPQERTAMALMLNHHIAIGEQSAARFLATAPAEPKDPLFVSLMRGKLENAALEASSAPPDEVAKRIALVYLFARQAGKEKLAQLQWDALLRRLSEGGRRHRLLADYLGGKQPVDVAKLRDLSLDCDSKRVFLRVVAAKFPDIAGELLPLARKLNYEPDEVALCLKKLDAMAKP